MIKSKMSHIFMY